MEHTQRGAPPLPQDASALPVIPPQMNSAIADGAVAELQHSAVRQIERGFGLKFVWVFDADCLVAQHLGVTRYLLGVGDAELPRASCKGKQKHEAEQGHPAATHSRQFR